MEWIRIGKWFLVADLIMVNVLLGIVLKRGSNQQGVSDVPERDQCGAVCQNEISRQVARLKLEIATATPVGSITDDRTAPTSIPTPRSEVRVTTLPSAKKVRTVQYVTIPGNGATRSLSWVDLSGTDFYFDKADYSGLVEVYFEANVSLLNGNGKAFVRLLDATHGIAVDGGEIQTSSQTAGIVTSGKLNFWSGKNLIRVQAKSLTSDTSVYSYGRLKVITEN